MNKSDSKCSFCGSGFNPRWDCTFNFTVHVPDLALVRFMVEDHDYTSSNDFLGQHTLPFTSLRTGVCGDSRVWIKWGLFQSFALLTFFPLPLQVTVMSDCLSWMAPTFHPPHSSSMLRSPHVRAVPPNHLLNHRPSLQPRNPNPISSREATIGHQDILYLPRSRLLKIWALNPKT